MLILASVLNCELLKVSRNLEVEDILLFVLEGDYAM